jgi:hypothetical protein
MLKYALARNPVHHLANVSQASATFWVFGVTLAIPEFFLALDSFQDRRSAIVHIILSDILFGISKTVAD